MKPIRFLVSIFYILSGILTVVSNKCVSDSESQENYSKRVNLTIQKARKVAKDCFDQNNFAKCSIWVAGACFSSPIDAQYINIGYKIASEFLKTFLKTLFEGGNDGWPSFATGDIYLRYRSTIQRDKNIYQINSPFDAKILEFKSSLNQSKNLTLNEMFRIVLTYSGYRMIDSTSNHETMNSVARFLAEQAFPGKIARGFNDRVNDTGEASIRRRCNGILNSGMGEYGSPNYAVMNFAPYLSVNQLSDRSNSKYSDLIILANKAYQAAVNQIGVFWFKGHLAMSCGRGYPNTYAFGAGEGTLLIWVYFGGNFPYDDNDNLIFGSNIKSMGILASIAYYSGYKIHPLVLQIGQCKVPRYSKANFALNHQSSYITDKYAHYSESRKNGGRIWQISWSSRIVFIASNSTNSRCQFNPVVFVTNPMASVHIDRVNLNASELYGSGSYGQGNREENLQSKDSVFHIYNINSDNSTHFDARNARGAIIYLPVPTQFVKKITWNFNEYKGVNNGDGFIYPVLLENNKKMFFGYDNVFIAVISSSPIFLGTTFNDKLCVKHGWSLIYNIFGKESPHALPLNENIQFSVGVETTSPMNFSGKNLTEKFEKFVKKYSKIPLPKKIVDDPDHPVFQYINFKGEVMTSQFASRYDSKYLYKDWIGLPWNTTKNFVDFSKWPFLSSQMVVNGRDTDYLINVPLNNTQKDQDFTSLLEQEKGLENSN